jgi:hypothetical protein
MMRKFSTTMNKEFTLTKIELKELNNIIKEPWVKPGKDKLVQYNN